MSSPDNLKSTTVLCRGGLDSNRNWLELSQNTPGMASNLQNFEPSLYGGYRRISGFEPWESTDSGEVAPLTAEGKIYGLAISNVGEIIATRKLQSGATYNFFKYNSGSAWTGYTTGLTLTSTGVDRIRHHDFNFDGTDKIIFADGVNNATLYDGTNWSNVDPAATGANFANAGGNQALAAPKDVHQFESHIFAAGDPTNPHVVAHSAPNSEYDWTAASGAGQINAGFAVKRIYPFRDKLFVFGEDRIKSIFVWENTNTFVIEDVTSELGLLGDDAVFEAGGDLYFVSSDGIRPISATERIGDYELASVTKRIQEEVRTLNNSVENSEIHAGIYRQKSQFRIFYSNASGTDAEAMGVLGALRTYEEPSWEFSTLKGIRVSCVTSGFFGAPIREYIMHGTHDGFVMVQETGNSFNGANIEAVYSTPYLDMQIPSIRKTLHKLKLFTRPEGNFTIDVGLVKDWGDSNAVNPVNYDVDSAGGQAAYGQAVYGTDVYGEGTSPTVFTNVEGSAHSWLFSFVTNDTGAPYTIQGFIIEWKPHGFK